MDEMEALAAVVAQVLRDLQACTDNVRTLARMCDTNPLFRDRLRLALGYGPDQAERAAARAAALLHDNAIEQELTP